METPRSDFPAARGDLRRAQPAEVTLPPHGIALLESHHAASFVMPEGRWEYHKLCWVAIGRGSVEGGGTRRVLARDDCILLEAGRPHRFVDDPADPLTLVIACFHPDLMEVHQALAAAFDRLGGVLPVGEPWKARNAFLAAEFRDAFRELLREQEAGAPGAPAMQVSGLTRLCVQLARGAVAAGAGMEATGETLLEGVIAYLQNHFREPVELDRMARRAGISRRRFTALFRQRTGESLVTYVNRLRVAHARGRLRETGHIAYSCYESGFQDLAYFYRVFKRETGQTPGQYLRRSRLG